jgi:hypothetical protein
MRANQFALKNVVIFPAIALLIATFAPSTNTGAAGQDQTFRLMNIERRLDQLQIRVDSIERVLQTQTMSSASSSNASTQALLELQRQQLSLAEQVVTMQKRMLEMQKTIDQLAAREKSEEKSEKPKEEVKPKAQPRKP